MTATAPRRKKLDRTRNRRVFANNMRLIRSERRMTQQQFGEVLGVSGSYIAKIERAEQNLSIDTMTAMADALGVPLIFLLHDRLAVGIKGSEIDIKGSDPNDRPRCPTVKALRGPDRS